MPDFILAIDQGTTSSRTIIFDRDGSIRAVAQREFEQHFPKPGWVEHDLADIWSSQYATMQEALSKARLTARDVAAVGITNQRETVCLWDRRTGEPVHRAIVWQDRRTSAYCDQLKEDGHEGMIREKTGLVIDAYFSASKLRWMLDNTPGLRERAERGELAFGTVDSWVIFNLTGGALHITDVTNASRTQLWNIRTGDWDDELLALFDIPRAVLPEVRPSSQVYGDVSTELLPVAVPIAGIAGDQQAATFGQACVSRGLAKNTYGTGCFMLMNTGVEPVSSSNKLLTTAAWRIGDEKMEYALEGSIFVAGAVVQWLRDGLGIIRRSSDVEPLARTVEDNGGVYLVPAFVGLGAPHWDQGARGTIVGITRGVGAGHLARAAIEGIAYQVADLFDAMSADAGEPIPELRVDGGAAVNDLMMQFQADIIGAPVVRPKVTETTALGAAYLAGLGVGFWKSRDEIQRQWQVDHRFEPRMDRARADELRAQWRRAVERAKGWE